MVRASQIVVGRKYDFENVSLDEGSLQRWVDAGEGNWTGWLIEKNQNDNGSWTCHFKDSDNGCDLYVTVSNQYNGFFQRPANRGEDFDEIKDMECNEDNNNGNNNNNNNNNNREDDLTVNDIQVGYQYRFENIALDEGSRESWVNDGMGNWTGWLISKEENNDGTWTCFFKDDETGCALYITVDEDYDQFFLVDDTYKEGQELEDIENLICEDDDNENNNNMNNQGGGRRAKKAGRKSSRKVRKTRKGKAKAKARKAKTVKRRKSKRS